MTTPDLDTLLDAIGNLQPTVAGGNVLLVATDVWDKLKAEFGSTPEADLAATTGSVIGSLHGVEIRVEPSLPPGTVHQVPRQRYPLLSSSMTMPIPFGKSHFSAPPLEGPYADIVSVDASTGEAFDKDGNLVLELDPEGVREFLDAYPHIRMVFQSTPPIAQSPWNATTWIDPCRLKADGPLWTRLETAPFQVDGRYTRVGDRILVTGQPDPKDDGIYVVGKKGHKGDTWVRSNDDPKTGTTLIVLEGDIHGSSTWVLDGTTWMQMAGAGLTPNTTDALDLEQILEEIEDADGNSASVGSTRGVGGRDDTP